MKEFDYELDYKRLDFTDEETRKLYRIGRGEQGFETTIDDFHEHGEWPLILTISVLIGDLRHQRLQ